MFELEHKRYKALFKEKFNNFISSVFFKKLISNSSSLNIQFDVIACQHRNECIDLLCNEWHKNNITSSFTAFDLNEIDIPIVRRVIDKVIKLGRAIIIIDTMNNNKIVGFSSFMDIMDEMHDENSDHLIGLSKVQIHLQEMLEFVNNDFYKNVLKISTLNPKYGEYIHPGWLCIHSDYRKSGIMQVFKQIRDYLMSELDYKYMTTTSTNKLTRFYESKHSDAFFCEFTDIESKLYDCSSLIFKDATSMNYYFDKYKKKYSLNEKEMNKLKDHCKVQPMRATIIKRKINLEKDHSIIKYYQHLLNRKSKL